MQKESTEFVIYIINEIADKIKKSTSYVYEKLLKTECIKNYLVPFYDVLHTMASEKVCDEVFSYVEKRGETL